MRTTSRGKPPAGGGMADGRPTAPGLSAALLRMRHHTRMALLSLDEMSRGPSKRRWGIIERLDARDVLVFIDVAFEALRLAAAVVVETSVGTSAPATPEDRQALKAARDARQTGLQAISATASVIERIATRILASPPPEGGNDGAIH